MRHAPIRIEHHRFHLIGKNRCLVFRLAHNNAGLPQLGPVLHHPQFKGRLINDDVFIAKIARHPAQALHIQNQPVTAPGIPAIVQGLDGARPDNAVSPQAHRALEGLDTFQHISVVNVGPASAIVQVPPVFIAHPVSAKHRPGRFITGGNSWLCRFFQETKLLQACSDGGQPPVEITGPQSHAARDRRSGSDRALARIFGQRRFHPGVGRMPWGQRQQVFVRFRLVCQCPECPRQTKPGRFQIMIAAQPVGPDAA